MKITEVRAKSADELTEKLRELQREQFALRVQAATGQLENSARVKQVRRDIARIHTVLNEQGAQ